jgi:hypothetical protein
LRAPVHFDLRSDAEFASALRADMPLLFAQGDVTSSAEIPT